MPSPHHRPSIIWPTRDSPFALKPAYKVFPIGLVVTKQTLCCCSSLHDELQAASKSVSLAALAAAASGQALGVLSGRVSALMAPPSELRSVSGPASGAHLRNILLCSQLHEVHRSLLMLLPKLPLAAAEVCSWCPLVPHSVLCCELSFEEHHEWEPNSYCCSLCCYRGSSSLWSKRERIERLEGNIHAHLHSITLRYI
jgi:hypothetical protein